MESNRQKFEELFSIELMDLFHEIQILIKDNAVDLLNSNNFNQHVEFIDFMERACPHRASKKRSKCVWKPK